MNRSQTESKLQTFCPYGFLPRLNQIKIINGYINIYLHFAQNAHAFNEIGKYIFFLIERS